LGLDWGDARLALGDLVPRGAAVTDLTSGEAVDPAAAGPLAGAAGGLPLRVLAVAAPGRRTAKG
ncbi:MAG: hypothetical protein GVY28_05670, partial [Alphaproteobacteria bacterium]|nr:hypothetical protein [Alphaproteobacteria bacterium]